MGVKIRFRLAVLSLIAIMVLTVGLGYATGPESAVDDHARNPDPADSSDRIVPPRGNITVVATDSNTWRGLGVEGPRSQSELVAFNPDGSLLHYDDSHNRFWDVDPVPGTAATVEYVYADHVEGPACRSANASHHAIDLGVWERYEATRYRDGACTRNGIERVNLTTGETTAVWSIITPGKDGTRYHDVDRVNETHRVVADIYLDRVFIVDVTADRIVWAWNASDRYPTDSGGPHPTDWTHINDVEVLPDGRIMASVRNYDQIVFIDPGSGLDEAWTLGAEDDYDVLYEQHNADYIPEASGGPAVIVADSENHRVQEFQRVAGEWERTWTWTDGRLRWPRDADRLPDGHTLVTDSHGDRVLEIDTSGSVVWSADIGFPYEAERLGTGDESHGGPSATQRGVDRDQAASGIQRPATRIVGGKYLNAALYLTPVWMGPREMVAGVVGVLAFLVGAVVEVAWFIRSRP